MKNIYKTIFCFWSIITIIICIGNYRAVANPLTNINIEDRVVYENFEASYDSSGYITTICPLSHYYAIGMSDNYIRVHENLNAKDDPGYYLKPINSVMMQYYYASDNNTLLAGSSGLNLKGGSNVFVFEDGLISLGLSHVIYYQMFQSMQGSETDYRVFRLYAKSLLYKFSFEVGIDNVSFGPGEYGLLLSGNVRPYPLVKLQTEEEIAVLGKWKCTILNGWLDENRNDIDDPMIYAMRIVWKPYNFIEAGITRMTLYSEGTSPGYNVIEYAQLAYKSGNSDNDFFSGAYGGYDVSIYLPFDKVLPSITLVKFYIQIAGGRVADPWNSSNDQALQFGLFFSTKNNIFRFEYVSTEEGFYTNEYYNVEGYSYNGLSVGYPFGNNMQSLLIKHRHYINDKFSFCSMFSLYQTTGAGLLEKPIAYSFSVSLDFRLKQTILNGLFRFDSMYKSDLDPLPASQQLVDNKKNAYIIGMSASYRL